MNYRCPYQISKALHSFSAQGVSGQLAGGPATGAQYGLSSCTPDPIQWQRCSRLRLQVQHARRSVPKRDKKGIRFGRRDKLSASDGAPV